MLNFRQLVALLTMIVVCRAGAQQPDLFEQHRRLMFAAISSNNLDQIRALLKTPYVLVNDSENKVSYLAKAAEQNRPQVAQVLIDAGADVAWRNDGNATVFHVVAANAWTGPLLGILIDGLKKETGGIDTPAFKNTINSQTVIYAVGSTALFYMALQCDSAREDGMVFVAKMLIETAHADPNIPEQTGRTPLWEAKARKLSKLVTYLESQGAH
jgi:ankyrin repeat protein